MRKNYFSDAYSGVKAAKKGPAFSLEPEIATTYLDRKTGAEYSVKSKRPNEAQGDFRVNPEIAEQRYRSIMGLPGNDFMSPRPLEDPFENERLVPEKMPQPKEVEDAIRIQASRDTKRMQSYAQTTEMPEWATGEWQDHEEYTVDPNGHVRDKPANREGPFGKIKSIDGAPPIVKRENVVKIPSGRNVWAVPKAPQRPEVFEERLDKIQVVLTNAFRGLFGTQIADHITTRSQSDNRLGPDSVPISRAIMDAGLMKPWAPVGDVTSDRPQKTDQVAFVVGQRAIQTLMKGPLAPELQDLPKAERDDVIVAIGRTILNSMTTVPQGAPKRPAIETSSREEIKKSISLALSPALLAGLVPSEMLDYNKKDPKSIVRTTGPDVKSFGINDRQAISEIKGERPTASQPQKGVFVAFKKKNMFTMDTSEKHENVQEVSADGPSIRPNDSARRSTAPTASRMKEREPEDRHVDPGLFMAV